MRIKANSLDGSEVHLDFDRYPDSCPRCHYAIEARFTGLAHYGRQKQRLEIVFQCPRENCQSFFVSAYYPRYGVGTHFYSGSVPFEPMSEEFPKHISEISPQFCRICNQSRNAESQGWDLVAGPGYRKALEFLVKDYLCRMRPADAPEIKGLQLGPCIENFVDNDKVKAVAKRAAWLGNDETHYVKKWEEKDLEDLKSLIQLTVHWIEMEEMTNTVLKEMPKGKK